MFIDSHTHLGLNSFCIEGTEPFKYDLCNRTEELVQFMEENHIDKTVILPIPGNNYDSILSNDYLIKAFSDYPDRFIPFAKLDDNLSINLAKNGFVGAKFHAVYERYSAKKFTKYLKILEYYGCPLIIHAKFLDKAKQLKDILKITPNLKIILAHMGRGHLYTDEMVEELLNEFKNVPNVYFETSTVGRSRMIEMACNTIGSHRLMFGSDYPFGKAFFKDTFNYFDEVEIIYDAKISDDDREWIFSKTILSLVSKNEKKFYVRPIVREDKDEILAKINRLNAKDKNFLALDKKIKNVRDGINQAKHIYVAIANNEIVGFFRESGRKDDVNLLEEFVIFSEYKGNGYANLMMDYFLRFFPKALAKSHSDNIIMNHIFYKYGFKSDDGKRIINWLNY